MTGTGRRNIHGFDGLRAIAVLMVFAYHGAVMKPNAVGHTGVLIFFGLSGYLIIGLLFRARRRMEADESSFWQEFGAFLGRRTFRIFPVYYTLLAVLAGLALIGRPITGWNAAALPWMVGYATNHFYALTNAWGGHLSHLWSLAIEEQFYVIAAPVLLLVPSRAHLALCVAAVVAGLAFHLWLDLEGASRIWRYVDSPTNFGYLALGGSLRLGFEGRRLDHAGASAVVLGMFLLGMSLVPGTASWLYELCLVAPAYAAGLLVLCVAKTQDGLIVRALEWAPVRRLGLVSYGFYLFHPFFTLTRVREVVPGKTGVLADLMLNGVLCYLLAEVSFRLLERPVQTWGAAFIERQSGPGDQ